MARETTRQRRAREERARQDANATRRAEAEAMAAKARADAEAAQARAAAETARIQAEVEVARRRAEAQSAMLQAEEARRKAKEAREPVERAYQLGINVAAPVTGYIAGVQLAKHIGAKHAAGVAAANKQLAALGAAITKTLPSSGTPKPVTLAKLSGMVKAADTLRLASRPAALGLATAAVVLGEGAFARFVLAPQYDDNKVAKEAISAVGTASIFAATTLFGKRLIANATTTALPDAKAVAAVEAARQIVTPASASAAPASTGARVASAVKALPKSKAAMLALAATGAAAVVASTSGRAEAKPGTAQAPGTAQGGMLAKAAEIGLTSATTAQALRLATSAPARAAAGLLAKVALPLTVASAVVGAAQGYRKTGTAAGALEGAANSVTGGGYGVLKELVSRAVGNAGGSVALMRAAAGRASVDISTRSTTQQAKADQEMRSDGRTDAYRRVQNGRSVFVRGYQTPAR